MRNSQRLKFVLLLVVSASLLGLQINMNHAQTKKGKTKAENFQRLKQATFERIQQAHQKLKKEGKENIVIVSDKQLGTPSFIFKRRATLPTRHKAKKTDDPKEVAKIFFEEYRDSFGIDPKKVMKVMKSKRGKLRHHHVKFQQYLEGLEVVGAQVRVQLNQNNELVSFNGHSVADLSINTTPTLSAKEAKQKLEQELKEVYGLTNFEIKNPELKIFDPNLFRPAHLKRSNDEPQLVWKMVLAGPSKKNERVFYVNAHTGVMIYSSPLFSSDLKRHIYDADQSYYLPGTLIAKEGEFSGSSDNAVNAAYSYAYNIYKYFEQNHGRDSIDDDGVKIRISVHYDNGSRPHDDSTGCGNAWYFYGYDYIYICDNMLTEELLAHEYTHGITYYTAELALTFEQGALNESYSDIFGSAMDKNWEIDEDTDYPNPMRDMSDPPRFNHPDKVSSSLFACEEKATSDTDYGGIHVNVGVPNKAAYLMAEGGNFNGYSISGIGRNKMEQIHYRALTTKLVASSNFEDNYYALISSCEELIGSEGISEDDCTQVENALKAVEMDQTPCQDDDDYGGDEEQAGEPTSGTSKAAGCSLQKQGERFPRLN